MKHFITITFLICTGLLFQNCDRTPECQKIYEPPQDFLDYWYFPEGSWWIYKLKDTVPAVYDTVRVTGSEDFKTPSYDQAHEPCIHYYWTWWEHSLYKNPVDDRPNSGQKRHDIMEVEHWEPYYAVRMHEGAHYDSGDNPMFIAPNDSGQVLLMDGGDTVNYVKSHGDLRIDNRAYKDCIEISWDLFPNLYYGLDSHAPRALWWCKNIGLVQMFYSDSTVWQLQDYHINR